jgi:hypothetical protein
MPNWCYNQVKLVHANTAEIKRVVDAYNGTGLMQEFYPCPQELIDTVAGHVGTADSPEQLAHQARMDENIDKYDYANWYDWRVNNWGTKWDVNDPNSLVYTDGDTAIEFFFDTAWAPPIAFYNQMLELGFEVTAYYWEPGMSFCGSYSNGDADHYDVVANADWVSENIPEDINEAMGIADSLADWEDEE